ncbi:hypothetical protein IU429_02720 [Nocardia elegans]|uniref:Protein phosphatase 2C domain-containing protein n=1 Tax=Nocardia elegans TaxID=300029 RepID=A0ABW6THH6_9NOCA|nr:hypothetical protein [Nocardia elegans]MBF6446575.1 hypothetical protein [Nocardia elegans]
MWVRALSVAKAGGESDENEDRVAVSSDRFAVADGVGQSARSEVWAQLLVDSFVVRRESPLVPKTLLALQDQWRQLVEVPDLAWYASDKLRECGGAATFVGLSVDVGERRLAVEAVGDSCFYQFRGGDIVAGGPLTDWRAFGSHTVAVQTLPYEDTAMDANCWRFSGAYEGGDTAVLATDAVALYLLRYEDRREELLSLVAGEEYEVEFERWVTQEREAGRLRDDDTTICVIVP